MNDQMPPSDALEELTDRLHEVLGGINHIQVECLADAIARYVHLIVHLQTAENTPEDYGEQPDCRYNNDLVCERVQGEFSLCFGRCRFYK